MPDHRIGQWLGQAVKDHLLVSVTYSDGETYKDFAPYIVYTPGDGELLVDGLHDGEPRTFDVFEIVSLRLTARRFTPDDRFSDTCTKYDACAVSSII